MYARETKRERHRVNEFEALSKDLKSTTVFFLFSAAKTKMTFQSEAKDEKVKRFTEPRMWHKSSEGGKEKERQTKRKWFPVCLVLKTIFVITFIYLISDHKHVLPVHNDRNGNDSNLQYENTLIHIHTNGEGEREHEFEGMRRLRNGETESEREVRSRIMLDGQIENLRQARRRFSKHIHKSG